MHRVRYFAFTAFLCLFCACLQAQSLTHIQYNTSDGLASPVVYCMLQDKNGFMWFGTEAGLCRFDGTHFTTYTTTDGLPDNEILKMYEDSKGRIWMLPFRNSICYYYNGKLYNQHNDSVLKKLNIKERIISLFEDSTHTIWMNELNTVFRIFDDNRVENKNDIGGIHLKNTLLLSKDKFNRIWFATEGRDGFMVYKILKGKPVYHTTLYNNTSPNEFYVSDNTRIWRHPIVDFEVEYGWESKPALLFRSNRKINNFSLINDSIIAVNGNYGSQLYNVYTQKPLYGIMDGKSVTNIMKDSEGNWWVTTLGDGVFRIQSENFRNVDVPTNKSSGIFALVKKTDSLIYASSSEFEIATLLLPGIRFNTLTTAAYTAGFRGLMLDIIRRRNKYIIVSDYGLYEADLDLKKINTYTPNIFSKDVQHLGDTLLLATNKNLVRVGIDKLRIIDTIWNGRTTCVHQKKDTIYVGTLNGLYTVVNRKEINYLGDKIPFFKGRISFIKESGDGSIWVGTTDHGLLKYNNNTIADHITMADGLLSNNCRSVEIDGNIIWLGTSKGLNEVMLGKPKNKIISITKSDGLGSDQVDRIIVYGDTVLVSSPIGMTYFNKNLLDQQSSECRLNVLDISGYKEQFAEGVYNVSNKSIKIDYVAISFKSAGNIVYRYRLKPIDNTWKTTRETTLEFVSLPYGRYDLELVAENKFGVVSNMVTIKLFSPIPFWKTTLFYFLAGICFVGIVLLLYRRRLKTMRTRESEKTNLSKKMVEMELKALRAQMNPHFTFNVLNSIQYYIGYNDATAAQSYLAKFARLIRLTLDNSKHTFIRLSDELLILKLYLELEKMRFQNFEYEILVDKTIDTEDIHVPNMLFQPFIENSIKHGFKETVKDARIEIKMSDRGDRIECVITDNGIGRSKAKQYRKSDHIPAGMSMVMDKTEALKYYYNYDVSVNIEDLVTSTGEARGTRIVIIIPRQSIQA